MELSTASECLLPAGQIADMACRYCWPSTLNCAPSGTAYTRTVEPRFCASNASPENRPATQRMDAILKSSLVIPGFPRAAYRNRSGHTLFHAGSIGIIASKYTANFGYAALTSHFD